jgi:hypothetical protein
MLAVLSKLATRRPMRHDVHDLHYRSGPCAVGDALLAATKRLVDAKPKRGSTAAERDALMTLLADLEARIADVIKENAATQWPEDPPVRALLQLPAAATVR